jgi:hypothetical protein
MWAGIIGPGVLLGPASGYVSAICSASSQTAHDLSFLPNGAVVSAACDFTQVIAPILDVYPGGTVTVTGDVGLTKGAVPKIAIQGEAGAIGGGPLGGIFKGHGDLSYSVAVDQTGPLPPGVTVTAIPVRITAVGETIGNATVAAWFSGPGANFWWNPPPNVSTTWSIAPNTEYFAGLEADCTADWPVEYTYESQSCQAIVDPAFQFDQADFTGGFNLADYYSFEYSSNLTPTATPTAIPEPSALILFGTSMLIFAPLLRRRFR